MPQPHPDTTPALPLLVPAELIDALAVAISERVLAHLHGYASQEPWPEWMAIDTAARYLDVSPQRLRKQIAHRQIPFHQQDRACRILFRRRDLDEWMAGYRIPSRHEHPEDTR
jgi:excisionase family DNA binding protein